MLPDNRCPWKFPIRSFPTVSCLCSLNRKCPRNCRLLVCVVAEHPSVLDSTHKTHTQHVCSHMQWTVFSNRGQQPAAVQSSKTGGVSYLDFLNNQYQLLGFVLFFFPLICKCLLWRITNTFKPGESPTVYHPSVYTWPQTTSFSRLAVPLQVPLR